MNTPKTKWTAGKWVVKQPGEHGGKLRVVHPIGVTMSNGKEVFGGVAEILTSRSSEDKFSDATEQANAQLIALSPEWPEVLRNLLAASIHRTPDPESMSYDEDQKAVELARALLAKLPK